jgi:hypothetical protein
MGEEPMGEDWKSQLEGLFVDAHILEKSKNEVREKFNQFCEFIAEPAFESLAEELKRFGVKAKWVRVRGTSLHFQVSFPNSTVDNFHYILILPKNAITLRLNLMLKGRRTRRSPLEEAVIPFMAEMEEEAVINLQKETLIMDFVERFRNFTFATITAPE